MQPVFAQVGRLWSGLRRIMGSIFGRATRGAGSVASAVGSIIAGLVAVIAVVPLLLVLAIVAVPVGALASVGTQDANTASTPTVTSDGEVIDADFQEDTNATQG